MNAYYHLHRKRVSPVEIRINPYHLVATFNAMDISPEYRGLWSFTIPISKIEVRPKGELLKVWFPIYGRKEKKTDFFFYTKFIVVKS